MADVRSNNSIRILYHLHVFRRSVQIFTILFLIAVPVMALNDYTGIVGTLYSISFWSVDIVDPAIVLQSIILNQEIVVAMIIAAIIPIVLAAIFGKVFCSWMCPFHFLSEIGELMRKKIKRVNSKNNKNPRRFYYWIGFLLILFLLIITDIPFITFLSIPGLISAQIADSILFQAVGIELIIIAIIILLEMFFFPRFWCKYACPVGATLAIFHNRRSLNIAYNSPNCADCEVAKENVCKQVCPLNLNPKRKDLYPYCNNCLECVSICQKNGRALNLTFNKK